VTLVNIATTTTNRSASSRRASTVLALRDDQHAEPSRRTRLAHPARRATLRVVGGSTGCRCAAAGVAGV